MIIDNEQKRDLYLNLSLLTTKIELMSLLESALDDGRIAQSQVLINLSAPVIQGVVLDISRFVYEDNKNNYSVEHLYKDHKDFPDILKYKQAILQFRNSLFAHNGCIRKDFKQKIQEWHEGNFRQECVEIINKVLNFLELDNHWPHAPRWVLKDEFDLMLSILNNSGHLEFATSQTILANHRYSFWRLLSL